MSLVSLALASAVALASVPTDSVHSESVSHRGGTYDVDYRAKVDTRMRTIGMASGARPSSQRCLVKVHVLVERAIGRSGARGVHTTLLPGGEMLTRQLPGDCMSRRGEGSKLVADRGEAIRAYLVRLAREDRAQALAAIDAAHNLAVNE